MESGESSHDIDGRDREAWRGVFAEGDVEQVGPAVALFVDPCGLVLDKDRCEVAALLVQTAEEDWHTVDLNGFESG